jgi:hypothetical protein
MNTILLQPTDVLFFRDGRPMTGSLAGHGAAWPLPNVLNSAFHAALHRGFPITGSELNGLQTRYGDHVHRVVRGKEAVEAERHRRFGSLQTAGPFPVRVDAQNCPEKWLLPRPADLQDASLLPALLPASGPWRDSGSLPAPLCYAVANRLPPAKESGAKSWLSRDALQAYLETRTLPLDREAWNDSDLFDAEACLGIGIDPETQTQDGERIYSAHYLRLKDAGNWRLGSLVGCAKEEDEKLFQQLLDDEPRIVVGGQQRLCTARRVSAELTQALPLGRKDFNRCPRAGKFLVKWLLLSPAIWPIIPDTDAEGSQIKDRDGQPIRRHEGGWLPNWIDQSSGAVLLKKRLERKRQGRRLVGQATDIIAHLVAAVVPKPIVVTGWNLGDPLSSEQDERQAGACSTHLAVPAGAVYYFEAASEPDAQALAHALNWHGALDAPEFGRTIRNRRSTLMGEKGFGLGVCGTWDFFPNVPGRPVT